MTLQFVVAAKLGGKAYVTTVPVIYSSIAGKGGSFKQLNH